MAEGVQMGLQLFLENMGKPGNLGGPRCPFSPRFTVYPPKFLPTRVIVMSTLTGLERFSHIFIVFISRILGGSAERILCPPTRRPNLPAATYRRWRIKPAIDRREKV